MKQTVVQTLKQVVYWISAGFLALLAKVLFRSVIIGRENIPHHGAIIVARHMSFWDIPLVAAAMDWRRQLTFVARRTLNNDHLWLRPYLDLFAISVNRENFSASDFKNVMRAIEADKPVVIFPEGSIQRTGQVFPGVIRFAERSNQSILPIRFEVRRGQYPPNYPFWFPALTLVIGKPFTIRDLEFDLTGDESKDERYEKLSQWLLGRIDSATA